MWLHHLGHISGHCHPRQELSERPWSKRKTPLRPNLSPPRFELWLTMQGYARQVSRTKAKSTDGSLRILPSRCLRRRPQLAVRLVDHRQPSTSDFLSGISAKRLSTCMFLAFSFCIRLASPFTANCGSHLSWPRRLARIVQDRKHVRLSASKLFATVLVSHPQAQLLTKSLVR